MELHQLRYFVAVAECGNFSRAAKRCGVAQPSLSQQIARLEKQLGHPLFDRLPRRVVLTDSGRLLLERAGRLLSEVDEIEHRLRDGGDSDRLSAGAIPTIAPFLLPAALRTFRRDHPNVELSIREDFTESLIAAVLAGELDLAIVSLPMDDKRLHAEPLMQEPLLLAVPQGHRLARRRTITIADLREEPFVLLHEMHCLGDQMLSLCRQHGMVRNVTCRGAQLTTVHSMVAAGLGVSFLPAMMCNKSDPGCRYRKIADARPTRTIACIWHLYRYRTRTARDFCDHLRRSAGGIARRSDSLASAAKA